MTFVIILGAFAGLYVALLLFWIASAALPLYAGMGAGLWLLDRGYGHGASIAAGLVLGVVVLAAGRFLCAILSPLYRGLVGLAFVVPAGFAGYQAARGLAGLVLSQGAYLDMLGAAGALTVAVAAWRSLGTPLDDRPEPGSHGATR